MVQVLTYSTREINRDFRIKVHGVNAEGKKLNTLVGVSGALLNRVKLQA